MYSKIISVSALNTYIKKTLDNDFILRNSKVKGELSNVKIHSSGHIYFSLKDYYSKINCVMFKSNTSTLTFIPKNGMNVIVNGRISIYEKEGNCQLYCDSMECDGIGDLYLAFEKLKAKLEYEGFFDDSRKKELPLLPKKIGVITSNTGAAIRDIINVGKRRNPKINLLIYPSLVQGVNAKESIVKGIETLNNIDDIDVIILARGGGSIEELWPFNEEIVARAIALSKKPIVTGIGHETDFTISDFVSDKRASTPSQAMEIVVPTLESLQERLLSIQYTLNSIMNNKIKEERNKLDLYFKALEVNSPENFVINQYVNLDKLKNILNANIKNRLEKEKYIISKKYKVLNAYNPLNVLDKGYGLIYDKKNKLIDSISQLKTESEIKILMKDGKENFSIKVEEDF